MIDSEPISIKRFSKLTGIKGSTLRYFDSLGLFSPAERGENNYRYYQPQQIITINSIQLLLDLDMPIREVCAIEKNRSPRSVMEALGEKELELEKELRRIERSYNVIHTLRTLIETGLSVEEDQIYLRHLNKTPMIIGADNNFERGDNFYDTFLKFCAEAKSRNIDLRFPVGGLYTDMATFMDNPSQPAQYFSYDPSGLDIRESGNFLIGHTRGYYGQIAGVQDRMYAYAQEHELVPTGPVAVIYLHDEICVKEQDQYLCEVQVRVE
jgi:DNA-binding transcriptional MerR regulator